MSLLRNFLQRNVIPISEPLPLTHTTKAYYLRKILQDNEIKCQPCDVFAGEKLAYCFVGRPAYKYSISQDSEYWNLPLSFVLEFDSLASPKRVFPFDSGGHSQGLTPSFISVMPLEEFEVSADPQAPQKLIGAFFETTQRYFRFKGRPSGDFYREFSLGPLDAEIHALHKLSQINRHFPDDFQDCGNHIALSPSREETCLRSQPMA